MKFLIISENGCPSIAWKLHCEGEQVLYYTKNNKDQLSGMVPKVKTVKEGLNEVPDIVLIDGNLNVSNLDEELRGYGLAVIGGSDWGNKLVNDQKFSMKAMESFGIRSPRMFMFATVQLAIDFVDGSPQTFIFTADQYVITPKSKHELLSYMNHVMGKYNGKCVLTEIIYGCDASIELWYSKGQPIAPPFTKLETYTMMTGDAGKFVDAQTSVAFSYPTRQPKLVQESLKKIGIFLERMKYTGFLCVNGIVKKGKFYVTSFSTSIHPSVLMLLNEPLGNIFHRMVQGDTTKMSIKPGFGYCLRVTVPPYPENNYESKNICIEGMSDLKDIFPTNVGMNKNGYYTCGSDVLHVASYGDNYFDAERLTIDRFRKLGLVNKQARIGDGAKTASRKIDDLSRQGYDMPPFTPPVRLVKEPSFYEIVDVAPPTNMS